MSRLLTDSWEQERHSSLKRWERGAQRTAWAQRAAERTAPPLPCPWRAAASDPIEFRPAYVLAVFSGDLIVVRFLKSHDAGNRQDAAASDSESAGVRVIRGGIPWERWSPVILAAWKNAAPVPEPFRLRMRLPPQWLEQALGWAATDQAAFLVKLRKSGVLSPLRVVTPESVAPWLRWDEMRANLMDFSEAGSKT